MTVFDRILQNIETTCADCLTKLVFATVPFEYDDLAFPKWPPTEATQGVILVLQRGEQEETDARITNGDQWKRECVLGLSLGDPVELPNAVTMGAMAEQMKDALIKALRVDKSRGGKADNTRMFKATPWSFGDGSGCGFSIRFEIIWRTAYNDPETPG